MEAIPGEMVVHRMIREHSRAPTDQAGVKSQSNKPWLTDYPAIENLRVHTTVGPEGIVKAAFDNAFFPLDDDDTIRCSMTTINPPNSREYRLYSEQDGKDWFVSEVSNIVLPAFYHHPRITQAAEEPSFHGTIQEHVDLAYSLKHIVRGPQTLYTKKHVALGEFKRNNINPSQWQGGKLDTTGDQGKLERELRG